MKIKALLFLIVTAIPATLIAQQSTKKPIPAITPDDIKGHIAVLADDSLQGRKPFSVGEAKTIRYIAAQFKKMGIAPGNKGSFFQDVPMVEVTGKPSPAMLITGANTSLSFKAADDFVAFTQQEKDSIQLTRAPLIFAGYGIVAPEYHWNDYANLDVKGKVVVVLVNDPGFNSGDGTLFKGDTMTYYGRWTYKYEEAARQGAAGVLIVHQTEPASYGWQVVKNSNTGSKLYLQAADKHFSRCPIEGWITEPTANKIFAAAGINGDLRALARSRSFKAIPLNLNITVGLQNKFKYAMSHNVIAVINGSERPDESIVYSAHWDHLGIGPAVNGDSVYNGAIDNASGVATVLAIAKAYSKLAVTPKRSIVFLTVTSEEQGLLGSEYYATHPIFPLNKTVANLNTDALNSYGETNDFELKGKGQNDLEDDVAAEAAKTGKHTVGDSRPGAGKYYRSDHFNFARVGVPAIDINTGIESIAHGADWGRQQKADYNDKHYHQPSDNYSADMDCTGMAQVANLIFKVGLNLADETTFPGWKKGSEFKAVRDKAMGN